MDLLLHTCCGPCATYSTGYLSQKGFDLTMYYYNPNIHPYKEWKRRKESLETFSELKNLPLIMEEEYDMPEFLRKVVFHEQERCGFCYQIRLEKTALKAKELGIDWFGTTLLISPYQNRDLICELGEKLARQYKLSFCTDDLRPGFRKSQQLARELDLYRQGYCGCIYSESDRYYKPPNKKN